MTTLEYKGYQGSAELDLKTGVLFGKVLFVTDLVTYEANTVPALQNEFQLAVDDYLETCQQMGRNPQQPCSGIFNVRVGPDLHRAAVIRAQKEGVKLNAVMVNALEQYLSDATIKHTHTHDHTVTVKVVSLSEVKRPEARMVGGFAMDAGADAVPLPGAVVGVEGVTLSRIPEGVIVPNAVDAAEVNPVPKPKARPRAKKTG